MKPLFVFAAVLALAVARPETYKEQEDFQYSRSSSDDGTKSGYYGAQRGNMGGNYERAHNMDSLAQNQMSGLVRQVEGELGNGAQQRTGSVYSAANSRGTYGSGHYDLSNLAGRNFQESSSFGNSHSSSSSLTQSSSAHNSAAYVNRHSQSNSGARYGGYQRVHDAQTQTDDLQSVDNAQTSNVYGYGRQASQSTGYQSSAGFQEQSGYDQSNANSQANYGSNVRTRLISATPVRIVITPGGRVAIPIAAQTYTTAQGSSYNQNALTNSESETLSENNQAAVNRPEAKHYESSYSYHKQWEKHDTVPSTIPLSTPTESTIPKNSELYEDTEAHRVANQYDARGVNYQNAHLSTGSSRFNNVKSASSQSRYQANYNAQESGASNSNTNAYTQTGYNSRNHGVSADALTYNAGSRYHGASAAANLQAQTGYNAGAHTDLNSQVEDINSKPKSYHSSYSYHKSWERQGDPYVIKPASSGGYYDGQSSQRLTAASSNQRYGTYHSGSNYNQDQADCDCDENGNLRIRRSLDKSEADDMEQQSVNNYDGQELVQQAQNTWDFDQHNDGQSQSTFEQENVGQLSQDLQDLGQQSQTDFDQQNVGQESQSQWDRLEDLGQQSSKNWGQFEQGQKSEDQNTWDQLKDIAQSSDQNIETLDQQTQNFLGQQEQDFGSQVTNDNQRSQKEDRQEVNKSDSQSQTVQHLHSIESPWDKFDSIDRKATEVTTEQTKNVDHRTESNEFYWHQISSIGGLDQQVNSFDKDSEYQNPNYDIKPASDQFGKNFEQSYSNVAFDTNNDKHYSYSSGFANPSVYNYPIPAYANPYQTGVGDYGIQSWNSHNLNSYSSASWQQYETNAQSHTSHFQTNPQESPLSGFWGKFDNIEKESLSTHTQDSTRDETHHIESNITSTDSNVRKVLPVSDTMSVTAKTDVRTEPNLTPLSREGNMTPQPELQTVSQQKHREPVLSTAASVDRTTVNKETSDESEDINRGDIGPQDFKDEAERPDDIGRGDIEPQDFNSTSDVINKPYKNHDNLSQQNIDNKLSELTVLSLEQQKAHEDKEKVLIVGANNTRKHGNNNTETEIHQKQYQKENVTRQTHIQAVELQNVNLSQQYVDNFDQMTQQHDKIEQNNYFQWQNVPNFEQENVNSEQQNVNMFDQESIPPQTVNSFEQNTFQDLGQQSESLEQQHFNIFEPERVPDSQHKNLRIWDNLKQGVVPETSTQEQQSVGQLDEKHVTHLYHDNPNVQNSEEKQTQIEQQTTNLEQHNQNMNNFDQENVNLVPQTVNKIENTFQVLGQQNKKLEQQNINNIESHSVSTTQQQNLPIWDNLEQGFDHKTSTQKQPTDSIPKVLDSEDKQNPFEQQSTNFEQQIPFGQFEQQNSNFEQQNSNFEQQNSNFEQQNQFGQFEQQNANFEQHNPFSPFEQQSSNFEQQNQFSQFEQQNGNFEQQNQFGQFDQQNSNFEQQNPFGQFEQQNANFEQQNQFGQDLVGRHFGQSNDNLEQQSIHNFEQESIQPFGQQHEPIEHDNLQSFSQSQSMQDFEVQKENIQQHDLNKFGQQSENAEDLKQIDIPQETQDSLRNALQHQKHPEISEELVIPKVYHNAEANLPKSSENAEPTTIVEVANEKPGFWKSVGNKFSNAKNKFVSWFKSN